jgi:transposase, IS30 family
VISVENSGSSSQRVIGTVLGRPASTICRELARGRQDDGCYRPTAARRVYNERRTHFRRVRRLVDGGALHHFVHDHLVHRRWSPAQIAQRLRVMKPDDPSAYVSRETIYAAIYAQTRGGLKGKRWLRPIGAALARCFDGGDRGASGSSLCTTQRGPYVSLSCRA